MPTKVLPRNLVVQEAWRMRIETYAHRISGGKWIPFPWLIYVLRFVQKKILEGNARIILEAPPRHGKSEASSHWLPTWYLDFFPEKRVILGSYGDEFAKDWGLKVRDEFQTKPKTWTRVRRDKSRADDWQTLQGGGMKTCGVGGNITGKGGDLIIIDDPHKDYAEAMSSTFRQKTIDWFNATIYTRLEPNASIVVCQTRWHEDDLAGHLQKEHGDDWTVIRLPAVAEEDDVLERAEGQALCAERYDEEKLKEIREALGEHIFTGLYQQRPSPKGGGSIKEHWFRYYTDLPAQIDECIQSWDLTFIETGKSYVVCQIWARSGANFYLVHQVRERLDFPQTIKKMGLMTKHYPEALDKLVENKANGPALFSTLKDQVPGIIMINPAGSKMVRLAAVSGLFEAGNVHVPDPSMVPWVKGFVQELTTFPNASSDDQVDTASQALSRLSGRAQISDIQLPDAGTRENPWSALHG